MKPIIIAALVAVALVVFLIAIAGSRRIARTWAQHDAAEAARVEIRQRAAVAEVPHEGADEEWAEVVDVMHQELEADPARTLPPPALDLVKHGPPEVVLAKPVREPTWAELDANPDEPTPLAYGEPPPCDVDASFTRAWSRASLDELLQRADADMLDALRGTQ